MYRISAECGKGAGDAAVLADAILGRLPCVKKLDVSFGYGHGYAPLAHYIQACPSLRGLSLKLRDRSPELFTDLLEWLQRGEHGTDRLDLSTWVPRSSQLVTKLDGRVGSAVVRWDD